MTRNFDPVFSAALRNELESLADQASASTPRTASPVRRRRQAWITIVTAVVLVIATVGLLRLPGLLPTPAAPAPHVTDPLTEILDPASNAYIRATPKVLLRVNGTGPGQWSISVPGDVRSIRSYLNCSSDGTYAVEVLSKATFGTCGPTFAGSTSDIPVAAGQGRVTVTVPRDTRYALLIIETPTYLPSTPWSGTGEALPYPQVDGEVLARRQGDDTIETGTLRGSLTGVTITVTCRGTGSVTVGTDFGTIGSPADYGNCDPKRATRSGGGLLGDEAVTDPRFTITPYGRVKWTVTITDAGR